MRTIAATALVAIGLAAPACGSNEQAKTVAKGSVQVQSPQGRRTVDFDVVERDGKVKGSIDIESEQGTAWSLDVACSVAREGALMIGGDVTGSAGQPPNGSHAAAIIRSGHPDRLVMWMEDPPPADTCTAFLAAIPPGVVTDLPPASGDIDTD